MPDVAARKPTRHAGILHLGPKLRWTVGAPQRAPAQLATVLVIGNGLKRPGLVAAGHASHARTLEEPPPHLAPVKEQRHRVRMRVYLDVGNFPLAAVPAPRLDGVRHLPGAWRVSLPSVIHGTDGQVGARLTGKRNARVEGLAQRLAREVHAPGPRRKPAKPALARRVVFVLPGAHARLAQIVHAGPDKVANKPRLLLGKFGKPLSIGAEGLAPQDKPMRVRAKVMLVAVDAVVVARDVHLRKGIPRDAVACGQRGPLLHESRAKKPGQPVVELASHRAVRRCALASGLLGLAAGLLV